MMFDQCLVALHAFVMMDHQRRCWVEWFEFNILEIAHFLMFLTNKQPNFFVRNNTLNKKQRLFFLQITEII